MSGQEPERPQRDGGLERNGASPASADLSASLGGLGGWDAQQFASISSLAAGAMAVRGLVNSSLPQEAPAEEPGEHYLVFVLADQELAVPAEHVQAVERLPEVTPVPRLAPWISGVMSLRGQIISIVDLRSFLGLERLPVTPRTRLLACYAGDLVIGLVVDSVSEMRGILPYMIQPEGALRSVAAWAAPFVSRVAIYGSQHVLLLDIERLLTSEKMQQYQN